MAAMTSIHELDPDIVRQAAQLLAGDPSKIAEFFIPAGGSLEERRPRTLKSGDMFAVFDPHGDALRTASTPEGIFYRDTRHLSHFQLTLDGARPILLSSTLRDDNALLTCDLSNPDLLNDERQIVVEHDLIHLRRTRFLWNGACYERLLVRNFDERAQRMMVRFAFDADFSDIFEARGTVRDRRGRVQAPQVGQDQVVLAYMGLDERRRATVVRFEPVPDEMSAQEASFLVSLAPKESRTIFVQICCDGQEQSGPVRQVFFTDLLQSRRALRDLSSRATSVATSNEVFNETARRSVSDLYTLVSHTPEGLYPYAGIPWFSTVFGRDGLIAALETLWLDPTIARGVLLHLAANQATEIDPAADAEPGKILHEVRYGEMAELGEVPFRRYYGSIDSTPLFVMLAGRYLSRTGDLATITQLWPHVVAALDWMTAYGDRDGDGFVEYGRRTKEGLANQGWKDSHDSVFHSDGTLAQGPIALVEVQAYVYGAWVSAAEMAQQLGHRGLVPEYMRLADELRRKFDRAFFDPALETYVLALDGDKKPCRVCSSNAGHALWAGIAYPERAEAVVRTLMKPSSFCGLGIRTVSSREVRYNPISYHNGSVWPHDNALIAAGFAAYGFHADANRVFEGVFSASTYIDLRRLPELICGFPRQRAQGPTFYPVACMPQAWAAVAPLYMLQSCLGLAFEPRKARITFDSPTLPVFLDEVVLRNLTLAGGAVDVALRRSGGRVLIDVLQHRGAIRVMTMI